MKQSPEYTRAQANMLPGRITADGFLGSDQRSLTDIILADEEAMTALGLSFETLCERMHYLLAKGQAGLGEAITIDQTWLVRVDEARGLLPSPFEHDGVYHKVNVEVQRLDSGTQVLYSDLSLHLIEKYHFFQGQGSSFRLDPARAKEVFGL